MESISVSRAKVGNCDNCQHKAAMSLESLDSGKVSLLCAKHYVAYEGEHELENYLQVLSKWEDYARWTPEIAKEITKLYPNLADKFGKTLRKIQQQEKRPKEKNK